MGSELAHLVITYVSLMGFFFYIALNYYHCTKSCSNCFHHHSMILTNYINKNANGSNSIASRYQMMLTNSICERCRCYRIHS